MTIHKASYLGQMYQKLYNILCGSHPHVRPWHFQWNVMEDVHAWQENHMKFMTGCVLDVGCGDKPYQTWCDKELVKKYIGLDIPSCASADTFINTDGSWPIESGSIDSILMTQSLEHVDNLDLTLSEAKRVLKSGGYMILTVPFLYPEHGAPYDFRRFTVFGLENLLRNEYEFVDIARVGLFGSVLAVLLLDFIERLMNTNFITRLLKALLLPVWVMFGLLVNLVGQIFNLIDCSGAYYCNACFLVRKK